MAVETNQYRYMVTHRWTPSEGERYHGDYTMEVVAESARVVAAGAAGGPAMEFLIGTDVVGRVNGDVVNWYRTPA